MKHRLIKTENYLVVVSDDEIKENTPYLNDKVVFISDDVFDEGNNPNQNKSNKKIIAHWPLHNALYLDGVDVLPEIEGDLHIYDAIGYAGSEGHPDPQAFSDRQMALFQGYADGYEKAKETYKYTEDDLRKAIFMAQEWKSIVKSKGEQWIDYKYHFQEIIQFLNQPKLPIAFEYEMICGRCFMPLELEKSDSCWSVKECTRNTDFQDRQKTFTNSEGRTEWIGKYLF
jgi:hypothetical protein